MLGEYYTKACVQYNDYCGTVAADAKDATQSITDLLKGKNFDFNNYFPYTIKLVFGEPSPISKRSTRFVVLAVKKDEVASNPTELIEYAKKNNNVIPTYRFSFDINPQKFFDEFKRFEIDLGLFSKSRHNYGDTFTADTIDEISLLR